MNCELQWSPCREDRFLLLLGNELRFYNADAALQSRPGEALRPPELFAVPFCDEHLPLRTVAWQPTSDYGNSELLAIGLSGGGGGGGGKLSRTETVLLVWDVHSQGSAQSVNSPKTALEATGNESVVSFDWVSEKNFVCGTASKHLRIYDLDQCSANQPIGAYDQESGRVSEIYGVCQDPFQSWRLATYADVGPGWLAVSLANSSYLTLHDLSHQDSQGHRSPDYLDDLAIATDRKIRCHFEQSAQPHLAAFDWHPKRQLAAFASENGKLKVGPIRERVSACLSGAAGLAYWDGESALRLHSAPSPPPSLDPMGALMWRRA
uniref:WD_REPEATS_REGION domain-containing protein n=1 Tax=Macrostomum lignano TaxID=282301 RepID=A0A1I8G2Z0_9PLAT